MMSRLSACLWLAVLAACASPSAPARDPRFTSPAARERGRAAYAKYCALCHGEDGSGQGPRHAAFARPPRNFTDQAWQQSVGPRHVYERIRDGVPGTAMPSWRALGDPVIADLTAYVISLGR
jgi:mono/diheme cytochrome c family protein